MTIFTIFDVTNQEQFGFEEGSEIKPEQFSCIVAKLKVDEGDFQFTETSLLSSINGVLTIYSEDKVYGDKSIGSIKLVEFEDFSKYELKICIPSSQYQRILKLGILGCFPNSIIANIKDKNIPIATGSQFKHKIVNGVVFNTSFKLNETEAHFYP